MTTPTPDNTTPHEKARNDIVTVTPDSINHTPPRTRQAIAELEEFNYEPHADEITIACMMIDGKETTAFPKLRTDPWKYKGKTPTPISISKARKCLATAYAAIPCELEGTDVHGYAWMVEKDEEWKRRDGIDMTITPPTKPSKPFTHELALLYNYKAQMSEFKLYSHLVNEGKLKLIEWFGQAMFADLHENGMLPVKKTPADLLAHLEETYSQARDNRRHLQQIQKDFQAPYDHKRPVEAYFMQLQEARDDAALLGAPYTEQQVMNEALIKFEQYLGKDAHKAELRWLEKTGAHTWTEFKKFWKDEIHRWETINKTHKTAHQATTSQVDELTTRMDTMQVTMEALQAENRSYQEQNRELVAQQIQFQQALSAEDRSRNSSNGDDVSTITDYMSAVFERGMKAGLNAAANNYDGRNHQQHSRYNNAPASEQDLLRIAKQRAPDSYKYINNGQGKRFSRYCWKCGCNCTHSTRGCYECTDEEKRLYRDATFTNTMGGSQKYLERRDKYQKEFGFDSL